MKTKNTFFIFIAVSLLLHAALFLKTTQQDIILPANVGNIISITISAPTVATTPTHPLPATKKPLPKKVISRKPAKKINRALPQIVQKDSSKKYIAIENKTEPSLSSQMPQPVASATSQARIISLLKDKVKQYFYYPKLAQRRNWQGKVLLVFDVNNHGLIKNITVKQSSGYSILDNAAKASLTKVSAIPEDWIKSEYYSSLKLTVKYRLEEG